MNLDLAHLSQLGGWIYVIVLVVVALDAILPVMPSESVVITGAVLAAAGDASLPLVILAGAAGALGGDLASFLIGRRYQARRVAAGVGGELGGRAGKAVRWAEGQLASHGPGTLLVCRFVPGGRTAATFTAGFVGMPAASFGATAAAGAAIWTLQSALIGFVGGQAFHDNLLLGVGLGVGLGVLVGLAVELVRHPGHRPNRPTLAQVAASR
jgi:membrane protein DedA with SNARE-associated domain